LHWRDQAMLTASSPTWCSIEPARGEKKVRVVPRSAWILELRTFERVTDFLIRNLQGTGLLARHLALAPLPQRAGRRGVVPVAVDDHAVPCSPHPMSA
jgi:hypothetical protein